MRHPLRARYFPFFEHAAPPLSAPIPDQAMLDESRKHAWEAQRPCSDLAWRLLDVSPKTRATLPEAAAMIATAAAVVAAASPPDAARPAPPLHGGLTEARSARKHPFARRTRPPPEGGARDAPAAPAPAAAAAKAPETRGSQRRAAAAPVKRRRLLHAD